MSIKYNYQDSFQYSIVSAYDTSVIITYYYFYFSFFNVDTFSSNTLLIKIDSNLQNFIIL